MTDAVATASMPALVLASQSPRRAELLRQLGLVFDVIAADVDERWDGIEPVTRYVERLACAKARVGRVLRPDATVIGADTAVVIGTDMFGKPRDRDDAVAMLARFAGRTHHVYSSVALADARVRVLTSVTAVTFRRLTRREIDAYWQTGEARDKAGAYAIQGQAAAFIERIDGSYSGVMGLPLYETARLLERLPRE